MSRSGYVEDCDDYQMLNLYRGRVMRAIRGKRGQKFLREIIRALDAMPDKRLISSSFAAPEGCCTIGAVARYRGVDMTDLEPEHDPDYGPDQVDHDAVAARFDIAPCLSAEIQYENDEHWHWRETPEERWERMRAWAAGHLQGEVSS